MQVSLIYFLLGEHEAENQYIKIGNNSHIIHFVKRKVDILFRYEIIKA
jgi:hypothetical protein